MRIESIITAFSMLGASCAFVFSVFQYYKTTQLQNFRTYADKYNSIIPPESYDLWKKAIDGDKSLWNELTPQMISYLNLIWEEYHLYNKHSLSKSLWSVWEGEVKVVLSS